MFCSFSYLRRYFLRALKSWVIIIDIFTEKEISRDWNRTYTLLCNKFGHKLLCNLFERLYTPRRFLSNALSIQSATNSQSDSMPSGDLFRSFSIAFQPSEQHNAYSTSDRYCHLQIFLFSILKLEHVTIFYLTKVIPKLKYRQSIHPKVYILAHRLISLIPWFSPSGPSSSVHHRIY